MIAEDHPERKNRRIWKWSSVNLGFHVITDSTETAPDEQGDDVDRSLRTTLWLADGTTRIVLGPLDEVMDHALAIAEACGGPPDDYL